MSTTKATSGESAGAGMMQALRFHGPKDLRLDTIPVPECGDGQVMIRPAYVGICGTDLHEYLTGPHLIPTSPHPITKEKIPLTIGHEFSGVVTQTGAGVTDLKVGDRVCVQPIIYDKTCGACLDGYINCCWQYGFIGISGWGGGLSDAMVAPRDSVYKLPDNVSLELGALVEPLAVAWHAVNISPFDPKATPTALVLGGGPIGLALVQTLKARGCPLIIVSEPSKQRSAFATKFGAHHVFNPLEVDIVAKVQELTDEQGVHVVYDAAGVQAGLTAAIRATRARGTVVNIAVWERAASVLVNEMVFKERSYMTVATYVAGDFADVIKALSDGTLQPSAMITRKIGITEVEEKGFKALIEDKDNQVKILVEVHPPSNE